MCFCRRVHWCPYWEVDGWLMLVAVGCCCPWHKMVYLQLKPLQNTGSQTLESRSCSDGVMGWWGDDCRSLGQTPGACSHVEQFLSFRTHPMADKNLNLYIYMSFFLWVLLRAHLVGWETGQGGWVEIQGFRKNKFPKMLDYIFDSAQTLWRLNPKQKLFHLLEGSAPKRASFSFNNRVEVDPKNGCPNTAIKVPLFAATWCCLAMYRSF